MHQKKTQTFSGWWFDFFCFHPYLWKWSNLTNIFQMGWNHQLVLVWTWTWVIKIEEGWRTKTKIHPPKPVLASKPCCILVPTLNRPKIWPQESCPKNPIFFSKMVSFWGSKHPCVSYRFVKTLPLEGPCKFLGCGLFLDEFWGVSWICMQWLLQISCRHLLWIYPKKQGKKQCRCSVLWNFAGEVLIWRFIIQGGPQNTSYK